MNTNEQPTNPNPASPPVPPLPPPLAANASPGAVIERLLKRPAELVAAMQRPGSTRLALILALFTLVAFGAYGLIVGSFSGGDQWLAAPLKISLGALVTMLICLPSLFIFACLTGAEVTIRGVFGVLCAAVALAALLLIGFAPVAWVFSQSTSSVAFIGSLHLIFWLIGLGFGLRLLGQLMDYLGVRERGHLRVWTAIFILVSLQMTTALRPIVGTSRELLPKEKKFFLVHWGENLSGDLESNSHD